MKHKIPACLAICDFQEVCGQNDEAIASRQTYILSISMEFSIVSFAARVSMGHLEKGWAARTFELPALDETLPGHGV